MGLFLPVDPGVVSESERMYVLLLLKGLVEAPSHHEQLVAKDGAAKVAALHVGDRGQELPLLLLMLLLLLQLPLGYGSRYFPASFELLS